MHPTFVGGQATPIFDLSTFKSNVTSFPISRQEWRGSRNGLSRGTEASEASASCLVEVEERFLQVK